MDTDLQLDLPQLILEPDRVRAAGLNLTSGDVALAVSMLTGGIDIAKYNDYPGDGERYDIRVKAKDGEFQQQADLAKIYLRNRQGQLVRLDQVARFREALGPAVIGALRPAVFGHLLRHADRFRSARRSRKCARRPRTCRSATAWCSSARPSSSKRPPPRPQFTFAARARAALHGARQPVQQLPAAVLRHARGAARHRRRHRRRYGSRGSTLNIYSGIGLVLLIGLVAKNSILLVDLTNQRRDQGMSVDDALRDACPIAHATGGDDLADHYPRAHCRRPSAWAPAPRPTSRSRSR